MSGINFRTSNFQVNTKLQRATVNNQKNEQKETKAAEKETQKPQVKLNIQTSGLDALGRYNMISINKNTEAKTSEQNTKETNNDQKIATEQTRRGYKPNRFNKKNMLGKLKDGDFTTWKENGKWVLCYKQGNGIQMYPLSFDSKKDAKNAGKTL